MSRSRHFGRFVSAAALLMASASSRRSRPRRSAETRVSYAALYLGLAAFLAIMCEQLHAELPRSHP